MTIASLSFKDSEAFGVVQAVDTGSIAIEVKDIEQLRKLQVNRLIAIHSTRPGQHLLGIVNKITRTAERRTSVPALPVLQVPYDGEESNTVRVALIGTLIDRVGDKPNVFRRTLEAVPEIDSRCFSLEGEKLTWFMRTVSKLGKDDPHKLNLGHYTLDDSADAFLSGDKFFQRHAVIVGSTGSGKSWTTARLLEQISDLPTGNAILFDIHGEYTTLKGDGICHYRVAGPDDVRKKCSFKEGVLYLPTWLLSYEKLVTFLIDRSDQNAPNQAMLLSRTITEAKKAFLEKNNAKDILASFTIDSPVPFELNQVLKHLSDLNTEMVEGSRGTPKQGEFYGKLGRLIQRLENRANDRRLGFMFGNYESTCDLNWFSELAKSLLECRGPKDKERAGVKIIDLSEVPSDVLPLVVSLIAEVVFSLQQWSSSEQRHPIAIFCDEAHLYIPESFGNGSVAEAGLAVFERIAKEGRKYGVSLIVISQRPSEVNKTVLSQCSNFVAMRLSNADDQSVIKRLLPDSLGSFSDLLPVLDVGEALVVGDSSLLPTRVRIARPKNEPNSGTIDFWTIWSATTPRSDLAAAVTAFRRQTKGND